MQKWVEGTVVDQRRWTERLFSLRVSAEVAGFEAGQFAKLALAVGGEMVARPYSFVNAPREHPHEFYYVTLPEGPLTQKLCRLAAGDTIYLAPRPSVLRMDRNGPIPVPVASSQRSLAAGTSDSTRKPDGRGAR